MTMYVVLYSGDEVFVGNTRITLNEKNPDKRARIRIDADRGVAVNVLKSSSIDVGGMSVPKQIRSRMSALPSEVSDHGPDDCRPE